MFDGFFEKNPPIETEKADKERIDNIKAAVLKSIRENPDETDSTICGESEVTPMKKSNMARTFVIAAAAVTLGAASLVSADSITDNSAQKHISDEKITNENTVDENTADETIADENITDGQTEFYTVIVIDENGVEHTISRERIEWIENENGTFDMFYDAAPEQLDKIREILGSDKFPEPEEVLKEADSYKFNEEKIGSDSEKIILPDVLANI